MFTEFANQVWTNSATGVVITNNTDSSIDGSSKKIVFSELGKTATITFDSVTLSNYEEISLHIYFMDTLYRDLFTITVGGQTFSFQKKDFIQRQWNHVLIDCSKMTTPATTMVFSNLIANLTIFVDYAGYRKVTYNSDVDIITALKNHINLDYGVSTTLTAFTDIGDTSVQLDETNIQGYLNDTSTIEINDGAGTIEVTELMNRNGDLINPLVNAFPIASTVRVICPVRSEDYDDIQPDPICGIKVTGMDTDRQDTIMPFKGGSKTKQYLGALGVMIYIDCRSKKKLLQMSREYNKKYGKEFQFLLDGEQVEIYMESSVFADDVIGNNPRMAYYYKIEPQPYMVAEPSPITTINLTTIVRAVE